MFSKSLSFSVSDDSDAKRKAVLEGGISTKLGYVLFYVISERRLDGETFSDHKSHKIYQSNTIEESLSLSDRFRLRSSFQTLANQIIC